LGVFDAIQPAGNKVLTKLNSAFCVIDLEITKIAEIVSQLRKKENMRIFLV